MHVVLWRTCDAHVTTVTRTGTSPVVIKATSKSRPRQPPPAPRESPGEVLLSRALDFQRRSISQMLTSEACLFHRMFHQLLSEALNRLSSHPFITQSHFLFKPQSPPGGQTRFFLSLEAEHSV
ncbi:hypothetical protein BaRGS_00020570 [Batillaria attramentaria]|uniref:Uncharacterized protein n=1 Tax=Batillaria attramentaria TaxID=370345 RepID=A0ABD0KM86_9CAEN